MNAKNFMIAQPIFNKKTVNLLLFESSVLLKKSTYKKNLPK